MHATATGRSRLWAGVLALSYLLTLPIGASTPVSAAPAAPKPATASTTATVLGVSADGSQTCAIRADGTIVCWGFLDDGGVLQPPRGQTFIAVDAAAYPGGCGIRTDHTILCWGGDEDEEDVAPPTSPVTSISVGEMGGCAIQTDQTLACWGDFETDKTPSGTFKAVSVLWYAACGIRSDGSIACWADDPDDLTPPPSGTFKALDGSCAIRTDGTLACWDEGGVTKPLTGTFKAVGGTCAIRTDDTIACWGDVASIEGPPSGSFKSVTGSWDHACAIRTTGTLVCWGDDESGQVTPRPTPTLAPVSSWPLSMTATVKWDAAPTLAAIKNYDVRYRKASWVGTYGSWVTWKSATTAKSATFTTTPGYTYCFSARARDVDGAISWWTDQMYDAAPGCTAPPVDDRSLTRSAGWAAGSSTSFYRSTYLRSSTSGAKLTKTGVRATWIALLATTCPTCGSVKVTFGSSSRTINLTSPLRVDRRLIPVYYADEGVTSATLTIAVTTSGKTVYIDGVVATRADTAPAWADAGDPPVSAANANTHKISAVVAGGRHTCAIKADGTLTCWGNNADLESSAPAGTFTKIAAGTWASCAIGTDKKLACWGFDDMASYTASPAPPDGSYVDIAVGTFSACAIDTAGALHCWDLGAGYSESVLDPPAGTYTHVGVGNGYACAIRSDAGLSCWGEDVFGELRSPTGKFTEIGVGDDHACAVREAKTLVCWGRNDLGQAKPPAGAFVTVAAGGLHACAITEGGTLACWGDRAYLESTPPTGTFKAVTAGEHHTCALRTTGTFGCWGQDRSGQVTPLPTATTTKLAAALLTAKAAVSWGATSLDPIASYDVRYRRAAWNGSFGAWTTLLTATTATKGSFATSAGYTYCYATRAKDAKGLVSRWTADACTHTPIDDRSLTRSSGWTLGTGDAYYRATYLKSATTGATLSKTNVRDYAGISLVATTCPTCGTVKVYWKSELLRQMSLYSATRVDRAVLPVTEYGEWAEDGTLGTVTIKVVSSGKDVLIDGIRFSYDYEGGEYWAQGTPTLSAGKQRDWGGLRGSNP